MSSERNKVPAPFLTKTYELVDDPATDDVVSWNESGTTFVVSKTAEFATDLLPNYFKHSNFSSFIRQLNTYGFRKIVADKWEFANENFRRGQQELLAQMRRRKSVPLTPPSSGGKTTAANPTSLLVNSGDEQGSSSTSSPNSKSPGSVDTAQFANLSGENEKLRRDNQMLSLELAHMKKQCDELIGFLTKYVNVGPDQINYIMSKGIPGSSYGGGVVGEHGNANDDKLENSSDDDENKDGECLKLFGVLMKEKKKKRGRDEAINNHIHTQANKIRYSKYTYPIKGRGECKL